MRPQILVLRLGAGAVLGVLAAGCGGGGSAPAVASVSSLTATSTAAPQSGLVAFAACMRAHGVLNFPDPGSDGKFHPTTAQGLDVSKQAAVAAKGHCQRLLPPGGGGQPQSDQHRTQIPDELSFAGCMRGHGVAGFPDPTAQGDLSVEMVQARGVDVHSPAVLRAIQSCLPASHGGLTAAKVREALHNARQ